MVESTKPALRKPVFVQIKDVEPGSRVNLHLKVASVNIVSEKPRYDGTKYVLADCIVGDQTGSVLFSAKNEQLALVKVGSIITVRNANANVVREHIRLEVDKWGKVEIAKGVDVPSVNSANNISDVEYELAPAQQNRGHRGGR